MQIIKKLLTHKQFKWYIRKSQTISDRLQFLVLSKYVYYRKLLKIVGWHHDWNKFANYKKSNLSQTLKIDSQSITNDLQTKYIKENKKLLFLIIFVG